MFKDFFLSVDSFFNKIVFNIFLHVVLLSIFIINFFINCEIMLKKIIVVIAIESPSFYKYLIFYYPVYLKGNGILTIGI